MYSEKVLKYFHNPKNYGKIKSADIIGKAGNPICGDILYLYIKLDGKKIKDVKFETLGCAAAIAVSSIFTEMIKGKTLNQALKIKPEEIVKKLGGLPSQKIHCSLLAIQALKNGISKFKTSK